MIKEDLENKILHDYDGTFTKTTIEKFAVEAFKSLLIEGIEEQKKYYQSEVELLKGAENIHWCKAKLSAFEQILQLIDTVKPKSE